MHKKFFEAKCGNIIKYRSNARNKNIYKCRMQRNMNINIDQMNIDRILEKTTYQYHWKMQEPWPNHVEREWMSWEVRVKREKWDWESSWVGGIDVCGQQFVLYRGHGHHYRFLNRTDSEGGYHCRILNRTNSEDAYMWRIYLFRYYSGKVLTRMIYLFR